MAVKHLNEKEGVVAREHCSSFTTRGSSSLSLPGFLNFLHFWMLFVFNVFFGGQGSGDGEKRMKIRITFKDFLDVLDN